MATTSLDIGNGAYAFYAHLIKASLLVKPGDKVTKGQPIAKLGNTGQRERITPALSDHERPSAIASPGTPYLIDSFDYQGQISPSSIYNADNHLTGTFFNPNHRPPPETRTNQLPMAWAIINSPG
jgi:murein DD-endopeptidase MepM/ murein hydrolase activator NlpD